VAGDPTHLARFEREARTLAALNHTNIAQVYGLEQGALAMEFVPGEDLSQRISRGPIPMDDALAIAGQVADALEAAHELGIIHRDLKPSNIRLREDGAVKVLDFGLAKALMPAAEDAASAPTLASPAVTTPGVILGTAAYMAPEQAKGKPVDKRADIWAFGVVLYEMITGRRPFGGDTVSETLAGVLKSEPDWSRIPARVQRLLRSCLQKDPKRRLRDIGDWTRELDEPSASVAPAAAGTLRLTWGVASVLLVATAVLAFIHFRETASTPEVVRFQIAAPEAVTGLRFAFRLMAYIRIRGAGCSGTTRSGSRFRRGGIAVPCRNRRLSVTWKPDSMFIAFTVGRALKKVPVNGGPVTTVCEVEDADTLSGGTWSPKGIILFGGRLAGALRQVAESGGAVTPVTKLDLQRRELAHGLPFFLPDGTHFLYVRVSAIVQQSAVFVGSLDRNPDAQEGQPLLSIDTHAQFSRWARWAAGCCSFARARSWPSRSMPTGSRSQVSRRQSPKGRHFGALASFRQRSRARAGEAPALSGTHESQLTWIDRHGTPSGTLGVRTHDAIALIPGTRAGLTIAPNVNADVWLVEIDRGVFTPATNLPATLRPCGPLTARVAFYSSRTGGHCQHLPGGRRVWREETLCSSRIRTHTRPAGLPTGGSCSTRAPG
jgi:hypothetical protein